jgi:hypothetical protein
MILGFWLNNICALFQAKDKILERQGNGINSEEGAALCRPLSEKHFAGLPFGNIV